jgi:GTP-binding protein EngB required for normal cell division
MEEIGKKKPGIDEKIKLRGKIQLFAYENFYKQYGFESNSLIDIINYKKEDEIIKIYEGNLDIHKYFNVIFFEYDNIKDASRFLKSFVETAQENCIAKNNSDYPIFVFFKNANMKKEKLYSYYIESTKDSEIESFYDLKSYNIFVIEATKDNILHFLVNDAINYFYEYDFKIETNPYQIEVLFMGQTGCGKSTFINYLLGKLRAYSTSSNIFKSRGGVYSHSKYPITITDSEGFELNDGSQQKKIFDKLKRNIDEELNHRTHIAFYLIPGPFNVNRDLDYSCIAPLIQLEQYNIHYYLIMTKEPEELNTFAKKSLRFLESIINNEDFSKIQTNLNKDRLPEILEKIKNKLQTRIFSVDVNKRKSKTISKLLNQINDDLKIEKENNEKFISNLEKNIKEKSNIQMDYSSGILDDKRFVLPNDLEKSPFFNLNKIKNNDERRKKAENIINEAKDVWSIRKLFFTYNSKIIDNRKKMLKEIMKFYDCPNLSIELIDGKFSPQEKKSWYCDNEVTGELGNKIINICEEEYNKLKVVDKYINHCINFNKSIDKFGKYVNEFLNFKINGEIFPYDCDYDSNNH